MSCSTVHAGQSLAYLLVRWCQVLESMQIASLMLVTIPFALGATLPDMHTATRDGQG
jgi:hypothetical protein